MRIKKLFNLAIPIFLEMLFIILLTTVDTIMISNYDESAVPAISNASTVLSFLTVLFNICAVGVSIVVSQYIGSKRNNDAAIVAKQGVLFNFILGLIIGLVLIFFNKPLLMLANVKEELMEKSSNYIAIIAIGLPFQAISSVCNSNLKANSKPLFTTISSLLINIINVFLNYILIHGKLGLPELGYKGAAIATMSCYILYFIFGLLLNKLLLKQNLLKFKYNKEKMIEIFKMGGPSALENICYNVSQFIVMASVNLLLTEMITARYYINTVLSYVYMMSVAFGSANAILVGYAVGNHNYDEAKKTTWISEFISLPIVLLITLILNIFPSFIFNIFTKDELVLKSIYVVLPIIFLNEVGRCTNIIIINALKSAGDVIFPVVCAIFSMFCISAFGSYFFTQIIHLELLGIFLAVALDEVFRAILVTIRFKLGSWKNKSIIKG